MTVIEPVFEGELVIGRYYSVPTVRGMFLSFIDNWPVLGPMHEDREIIGFEAIHYHFDWRFFSESQWEMVTETVNLVHAWPLVQLPGAPELGPVVYRRRKYQRPMPQFPREFVSKSSPMGRKWLPALEAAYADATLKPGLICPHRGGSLRGLPVDWTGCVVCPLHGLRWNIVTGKLVPEGE